MTCVWSSRPELRQRLERGTASISAGQGPGRDVKPGCGPGPGECSGHWVGGLKGFSWPFTVFLSFSSILYVLFCVFIQNFESFLQCWKRSFLNDTMWIVFKLAACHFLPHCIYWIQLTCAMLQWTCMVIFGGPVWPITCCFTETGSSYPMMGLSWWSLWNCQTTVGFQDETPLCRHLLKKIGSVIPVVHFHHLWIKSSKLLSGDLKRTVNKK